MSRGCHYPNSKLGTEMAMTQINLKTVPDIRTDAIQHGTAAAFNHCSSHDDYDLVFKAVEMQLKHLYERLQPSLIPGKPESTIDSWLWKEYYSFCKGMDFILQAQQYELVKNILGGDRNV